MLPCNLQIDHIKMIKQVACVSILVLCDELYILGITVRCYLLIEFVGDFVLKLDATSLFLNCFSFLDRYSLRGEVNGEQQHSPRSSSGLFNGITAMHTWMQKNKMLLTCKLCFCS